MRTTQSTNHKMVQDLPLSRGSPVAAGADRDGSGCAILQVVLLRELFF